MGSFLSASVLRSQMGSPESPDRAATSAGNIGQRKPTASCPAGEHLYAFHALPQILSFYFTMISSLEICRGGGHSCARFTSDSSDKLFELIFIHLDNIFGVREHLLNAHFPCASSDILLELISINCQTKEERLN